MKMVSYNNSGKITSALEFPEGELYLEQAMASVKMMGWSGAIQCPEEVFHNRGDYYVVPGVGGPALSRRHPMELVLAGMELRGVPDGATVSIEGKEYTADGTDIELSFSHPGTFTVTASLFPWLDTSVEVVSED